MLLDKGLDWIGIRFSTVEGAGEGKVQEGGQTTGGQVCSQAQRSHAC